MSVGRRGPKNKGLKSKDKGARIKGIDLECWNDGIMMINGYK